MLWLYITLGVIGFLAIVFFIALIFIHHVVFYTPIKTQNDDFHLTESTQFVGNEKEVFELIVTLRKKQADDVYVTSYDKLKLHARLYRNENSNVVAIMFHGYRGTARRDFSGGALHMLDRGYNVLLIDERGHGESEGHNITFGNREKHDVLSWMEYVKNNFPENVEIILVGISMGAATILYAAEFIPGSIKMICDCPYSTGREIISSTIEKLKLPVKIFFPIVNLSSILFSHASLTKDDASKSLKNSNHKVLIIHGDKDTIVPHQFSYRIYQENKEKVRYELFPNTDHGVSYLTDTARYLRVIDEFLDQD